MNKLSIRDLELAGKRVFVRVDFNVPLENGQRGGRHAHPRNAADAEAGARTRGAAGAGFSSGPAEGQARPEVQLAAGGGETGGTAGRAGGVCGGLRGRGGGSEEPRAGATAAVLLLENVRYPSRGGGQRRGIFAAAGGAVRRLIRVRRVWLRASRARFGSGDHAIRAAIGGGPADGARAELIWGRRFRLRSGRSWPCWAAPKFPTRSKWSKT